MKLNKKGYTLIELLVVIVVIGLILGFATFGIIKAYNNSKGKASDISEGSIIDAGETYANEKTNDENYWKNIIDKEDKYFCVTIEELMNKGLLDKKANIKSDKFNIHSYVLVKKNKVTSVNSNGEILTDINSDDYKVCSGSISDEKIISYPKLDKGDSYTDEIDVPFSDAITDLEDEITDRVCMYGDSSANIKETGTIEGNDCKLLGLKQNSIYYLRVCMKTSRGNYLCSNTESRTTKKIKDPIITINNNVNIEYKNDGINGEAGYYFNSTINGTSDKDVQECTLSNNIFTCNGSTTNIEKNIWYRSLNKNIGISYTDTGTAKVTARTVDKSNNYNESTKSVTINKYTITFIKEPADKIGGETNNITKSCYAINEQSCSITSPTIEKAGYTAVGWNTNKSATTSSWNVNTSKSTLANTTYYPILKANTYTITLDNQGATSAGTKQVYYQYNTTKIINGTTCYYYTNSSLTTCLSSGYNISKPTKSGYAFKGYYTSTNGSGTNYVNSSGTFINNAYKTMGNKVLYAAWKDTTPPSMDWGPSTGTTWCTGKEVWVKCSDSGSGMKETYMNDNGTVTTGTTYTSQGMSTRSGNKKTYLRCTDNAGNVTEKTIWNYYVKDRYCSDVYYCRNSSFGCETYNARAASPCSCKGYTYSNWKADYTSKYTLNEKACKAKNKQGDLEKVICTYKQRTCNCGYWSRTKTCSSWNVCRNSTFGCQTYKEGNCGCNSYSCSY